MKELSESVEVKIIGSRDVYPRPHLKDVLEYDKDRHAIAKLSMYDAAGWYGPDELQKVIDEFRFGDSDVKEWVEFLKAKSAMARADQLEENLLLQFAMPNPPAANSPMEQAAVKARAEAIAALREVVRLNPDHPGARETLVRLELMYLDVIGRKLDDERKLTLAGFRQYLKNRGFETGEAPPAQPGAKPEPFHQGWWDGSVELVGVVWAHGISAIGNGLRAASWGTTGT